MITTKKKRILRALACLTCTVTIASVNTLVYAEPSTKELENTTSGLQSELNNLNSQLATLSKELDDASAQIEAKTQEVEKAKLDLVAAELNENSQYTAMKSRIQFMYEGGSASLLEILFSSESMADFLNKAEFVSTISEYDRKMLDDLRKIRTDIEKKQTDIEAQQAELTKLQKELSAKQETLNSKVSSTSSQLSDYSAQLTRAREAEAAAAAAAAREAAAKNNSNSGVTNGNGGGSINNGGSADASTSELVLFAAILEAEAGGTNYEGLLAVSTVVMNRVESPRYPNTLSGVIYQSGQFAPTWDGALQRVLAKGPTSTAYQVAQEALGGTRHASVIGCYQFRSSSTGVPGISIGGNTFF